MATYTAKANYVRMTPRKLRAVAGLLRRLPVNEAEAALMLQPRRAARPLMTLLRSAIANAKNSGRVKSAELFIEKLTVDQGPMLKRYLPRARGSASPIQKKMSHVTLVLGVYPEAQKEKFAITVKKKIKLPDGTKKEKKEKNPAREAGESTAKKPEKPGMFGKVFRRKAMSEG